MTWNSLAALLAITSVVTTAVSVSLSVYLLRGGPQNINTQTVTIEQPEPLDAIRADLAQRAYRELMDGMRRGSGNSGIDYSSTGDGSR